MRWQDLREGDHIRFVRLPANAACYQRSSEDDDFDTEGFYRWMIQTGEVLTAEILDGYPWVTPRRHPPGHKGETLMLWGDDDAWEFVARPNGDHNS
jgi:hypothetical protein